ncbi:hypothetical protein [Nonomuraea maritima]|uniref:hypothetical protein n=1 Tax=Nonomuraea maritima TaxID=683260 RepID=UPI0037206A54
MLGGTPEIGFGDALHGDAAAPDVGVPGGPALTALPVLTVLSMLSVLSALYVPSGRSGARPVVGMRRRRRRIPQRMPPDH